MNCCRSLTLKMQKLGQNNSGIALTPPVNTVAPVVSGNTTLGSVLSVTTGTWTGTTPITYTYQWQRNGVDIVGQTNNTYTLVLVDSLKNIKCIVKGTNTVGNSSANSNAVVAGNYAPNAPVQNAISNLTDVSFSANWIAPVSGPTPTGYWVYLYQTDGTTLISRTNVGNVLTYSITGLTQNTNYKTQISAYDAGGEGAKSSQVSTTTYTTVAQGQFTRNSITDATEKAALNQFVIDVYGLTGNLTPNGTNVAASCPAIYPGSPTSLSAASGDLLNAFNITWVGSPVFATTGITGGTSGKYGKTGFIPNVSGSLNSFGLTICSNTESQDNHYEMGAEQSMECIVGLRRTTDLLACFLNQDTATISISSITSKGAFTFQRTAAGLESAYRNGVHLGDNTNASTALPTVELYLLGYNISGSHMLSSARSYTGWAIHSALSVNQIVDLHDAFNRYNANVISGGRL